MHEERIHKIINGQDCYYCNKCKRWRPRSRFNIDRGSFIKTEVEFVVNVKIAKEKDIINKDKDCQKIKNWY